ncbi:MAG: radical SAM protein [Desulfobacteraceae bacterium]|nr:MAG: radical SAM protein [Desulfobacteraceae bacterium]
MKCNVCEIGCRIEADTFGRCSMYTLENGTLKERFAHQYSTLFPISIETVPTLHFFPNHKFLQVSTIGCNFRCPGCISEILATGTRTLSATLKKVEPNQVVKKALRENCTGIVFCINDPSVSYFSFLELARMARKSGLKMGFSFNGYLTQEALLELIPHTDFVNIGIKGFSDRPYRTCGALSSGPVLRNLKILVNEGVHVEVAAIHMKNCEDDIKQIARYTAALSRDIPFQVMRFVPFGEAEIRYEPTIRESETLCTDLQELLSHVYLFNSPGSNRLNTLCSSCGRTLITREFFGPMGARNVDMMPCLIEQNRCQCRAKAPFEGSCAPNRYDEHGFFGGYRTTRAFEMLHAILVCIGTEDPVKVSDLWFDIMNSNYLKTFHDLVQLPHKYGEVINYLSEKTDRQARGKELRDHINQKLELITSKSRDLKPPTVYYAMGYPLFALNAERFETNLVEAAGGRCLNKQLTRKGKPGVTLSRDEFMALNPEVIFISGFLSCPASDFIDFCLNNDLDVAAVRHQRIYDHFPLWDFGSPRWILGLMHIANTLHPDVFSFDMKQEADTFYRQFFNTPFEPANANRSFYRV